LAAQDVRLEQDCDVVGTWSMRITPSAFAPCSASQTQQDDELSQRSATTAR